MLNKKKLLDDLFNQGWFCQKDLFDKNFVKSLCETMDTKILDNAGIGLSKVLNSDIRKDKISWIEKNDNSKTIQNYLKFTNDLSKCLNEEFYLGINDFECHLALYEPGGFYKPHYDNLQGKNNRAITIITYLNQNWIPSDGGVLRLKIGEENIDISPLSGTTVVFMSDLILHEVTQSNNIRKSITGWFIKNKIMY